MTLIRTQINLEEEQHRILSLEAKRQNKSLSELVRRSINGQIIKLRKKKVTNPLLEIAKHAVNFKDFNPDAPDDLAENHDEYLYGKKSNYARKKMGWKK